MTATVTKEKGLWSIARENGVKVSDLYKANPGLEDMQKKGTIPNNHKIEIPTKSKTSTPKPKPKSTSKKTVKNSSNNKSNNKVANNAKSIDKCKCNAPSWMKLAKSEMAKKIQRHGNQSSRIKEYNQFVDKSYGVGTSWCGTFVNWVLTKTNNDKINNDLEKVYMKQRAIHWAFFGKRVHKPIYGAIAVKPRGNERKRNQITKDSPIWIRRIKKLEQEGKTKKAEAMAEDDYSGGGHVGFILGVDKWPNPKYIYILGGNQWGYPNTIPWGNKKLEHGKMYIRSVLFPSRYKIKDWTIGFFVPSYYNTKCCNPKIYTGKYIISKGDGA